MADHKFRVKIEGIDESNHIYTRERIFNILRKEFPEYRVLSVKGPKDKEAKKKKRLRRIRNVVRRLLADAGIKRKSNKSQSGEER